MSTFIQFNVLLIHKLIFKEKNLNLNQKAHKKLKIILRVNNFKIILYNLLILL
jgi:hypothetical protein